LPIFSFLSQAVYPVGMTIYGYYFFVNNRLWYWNQIWHHNVPLCWTSLYQISRQSGNVFAFYGNFNHLMKRKNKETQPILKVHLRQNLVTICNASWWHELAFPMQKPSGFIKVSQSYVYIKVALLFFLLITYECGAPAS